MRNWTPVVVDVGVGAVSGVADQLVQNWDEKRRRTEPSLSFWKQGGTYLNYGVPILAILAMAMGWGSDAITSKGILVGSQLAGRKATYTMTKAAQSAPYRKSNAYHEKGPVGQTQKQGFEKVGII